MSEDFFTMTDFEPDEWEEDEPNFDDGFGGEEPDWGDDENVTTEDVFTTNGNDPPPF